jgi:uncharacterized protein (TIGR02611 family)
MSAGVERSKRLDYRALDDPPASDVGDPPASAVPESAPAPETAGQQAAVETSAPTGSAHGKPEPHDHHLLIDAHEDRWRWRRKIRQNPRKLFFYRMGVAVLGLLSVILGCITGPLPGPGGIPLILLGIAIWSSEFEWAQRLMFWFKAQLKRYQAWPRKHKLLFWATFAVCCGALAYSVLLIIGIPFWVPDFARNLLTRLPGV